MKAHKKLYQMVCSAQHFQNGLISAFSPTYTVVHGFLPKVHPKLIFDFLCHMKDLYVNS